MLSCIIKRSTCILMSYVCIMHTCYDTLAIAQTLQRCTTSPLCFTAVVCVHIPSCNAGPLLALVSPRSAQLPRCASLFFFSHCHNPAYSSLKTHGGGVRCQMSCSLPPPRAAGRSLWKNYSDICMCHSYKAPGMYPPTYPPAHLIRLPPSSLPPVCTAPPPCTCGNHFSNY